MPASVQTDVQPASASATFELFWVMTVQTADGRINTRTAVITVPVGFTRAEAFDFVFKQFKEDLGSPLTVLFFDLAENEI